MYHLRFQNKLALAFYFHQNASCNLINKWSTIVSAGKNIVWDRHGLMKAEENAISKTHI